MDDPSPQAGTSADDLRALEALDLPHLRNFAKDLIHENRRLRLIQKTLAKAGVGTGAVVELYSNERFGEHYFGFVICRADRDEVAFCGDVREAIDRHLGPVLVAMNQKLLGTSAVDRKRAPETPEDRAALATAIYEALVENGEIEHSLKACVTEDFCVLYGYGAHLDALAPNVVEVASTYTAFAVRRSYLVERLQLLGRAADAARVRNGPVHPTVSQAGPWVTDVRLLVCELGGAMELRWSHGPDHDAQVRAALDAFRKEDAARINLALAPCPERACMVYGLGEHVRQVPLDILSFQPEVGCYTLVFYSRDALADALAHMGRERDAARVRAWSETDGATPLVLLVDGRAEVFTWDGKGVVGQ